MVQVIFCILLNHLKKIFFTCLGAIEITIATMSKSSRCTTDEVYVVGFVPTYLLPNKTTISLDPFLEPLIRDIENGFINGIVYSHISFVPYL